MVISTVNNRDNGVSNGIVDGNGVNVSVVVSSCGSVRYLKKCLDSVFSQKIAGLEVIAVLDGSADDSAAIMTEYASKHDNLRIFTLEKCGLPASRNLGLLNATGKYAAFMDAWDFYPNENVLAELYYFAESGQLEVTGGYRETLTAENADEACHKPVPDDPLYLLSNTEKKNLVCPSQRFMPECMPQAYLFNVAFLKDNHLEFPDHHFDYVSLFLLSSVRKAGKFGLINRCSYVNRFKCTDTSFTEKTFEDLIISSGCILRYSSEHNLEALHERIFKHLNITMKNTLLSFLKQKLSVTLRLCPLMCYELGALNYEILPKTSKRPCRYSPFLESAAEVLTGLLMRNEIVWNDADNIMKALNSVRNEYLKLGGDSSHIDIFLIKVLFCLWRPNVPHYIRMAVYEAVRANAFCLDKLINDSRLSVNKAKLTSIIPAMDFNRRYQNRNNEIQVEVIKSATATTDNIILSVIIPVYNVEKYLKECLDSIVLENNIPGLEVICINDGSRDGSLEILKAYADKHQNITVLSQDNAGLSAARNSAMKYAKGKYVHFLDSDDAMTPGCYQKLLDLLEKQGLDVLFFNARSFYEEEVLKKEYPYYHNAYTRNQTEGEVTSGMEYYCKRLLNNNLVVQACMYISRRSFLEENHLVFPNGIIHEDNLFTIKLLALASRVMHVNNEFYHRRVRRGSLTINKIRFDHAFGYYITYKELMNFTEMLNINMAPFSKDYLYDRCYAYRNLAVDKLDKIEDESEKFYYLALDSDLSLQFFNDVVNPLSLKNVIKSQNDRIVQQSAHIAEINKIINKEQ